MSYAQLFQLNLRHDYFPDQNCRAVEVVPTAESARIMQQLQIGLVRRETGSEAFYDTSGPLTQAAPPPRLTFILRTVDHQFLNYTRLPLFPGAGRVQYFTNLATDGPSATFAASSETDLPGRPAAFTVRAKQAGNEISLYDERGNKLYASFDDTAIQATAEDAAEFRINLHQEAPGRYRLREGDAVLLDFVLLPQNWAAGDLGLFTVHLGATDNGGHHILDAGTVVPADFTVGFTARATTWRYHLIDSRSEYEAFQLLDPAGDLVATPPLSRRLPDGSEAVVLATPYQLPLRQRPGQRFTLRMKKKGDGGDLPITINLPSADATRLSRRNPDAPNDDSEDDFYSDLYVYL